jgi:hypothetical protein
MVIVTTVCSVTIAHCSHLFIANSRHNQQSVRWGDMARPDEERPGSGSHWVKSSLSFSNGNCVEVANLSEGGVAVRNSRDPEGPVLRFTPDEWHAFLGGAQLGEFDSFGRLRFKSREQRRVLPDGPGGPSAAAWPQIASSPAEPFAGWRNSPAYGAGSRLRCGRRAAACAGACREYGEPPGALRFTVPTSAPRRTAAGCLLRHRGEPGAIRWGTSNALLSQASAG